MCVCVCVCVIVWLLKKVTVRFGLKGFAERTLSSWWARLQQFVGERQEVLVPGPIRGLSQFLLRIDTKVTPLVAMPMVRP